MIHNKNIGPKHELVSGFQENGWSGPFTLYFDHECDTMLSKIDRRDRAPPVDWLKGNAVSDRLFFDAASHSRLVNLLELFVGKDVILWGASLLTIALKERAVWQRDVEVCKDSGCSVSLVIGLGPNSYVTSCRYVKRSHFLNCQNDVESCSLGNGRKCSEKDICDIAKAHGSNGNIDEIIIKKGEGIFFKPDLWRVFYDEDTNQSSKALLLQYSTPDTVIRVPAGGTALHCSQYHKVPLPPCILIQGNGRKSRNRIVSPPLRPGFGRPRLSTLVRQLDLPLVSSPILERTSYQIFHGSTSSLAYFGVYASVLRPGGCPHIPHAHDEEEILIVIDGFADLIVAEGPDDQNPQIHRIGAGDLIYYPSFQHHTIRNAESYPLTYLMLKWRADEPICNDEIGTRMIHSNPVISNIEPKNLSKQVLLEGRTRHLSWFHIHASIMRSGASYDAHADSYDVAILVLEGTVNSIGQIVRPNGVILYSSGESHGMANKDEIAARYLVFEFHNPHRKAYCFDNFVREIR